MHNRFPTPSEDQIRRDKRAILFFGAKEILSGRCNIWDLFRYAVIPRQGTNPTKHGLNPTKLSSHEQNLPATLFIHCDQGKAAHFLPYASAMEGYAPLYTFGYENEETAYPRFMAKIKEIRELHGQKEVNLSLVGHSFGAILSARYAFDPEMWLEGIHIQKVISIAGRLKNLEPPHLSPFYGYCHTLLPKVDKLHKMIEEFLGETTLFTIAAEHDSLLPRESVLIGKEEHHCCTIPGRGHLGVLFDQRTIAQVKQWLC